MKSLLAFTFASILLLMVECNQTAIKSHSAQTSVVDAACGQCLFDLKEKKGCDLAVHFGDKSYFVDGFTMKQSGDAHADDGMYNAIRKAKVTGEIVNGRFVATRFDLPPQN